MGGGSEEVAGGRRRKAKLGVKAAESSPAVSHLHAVPRWDESCPVSEGDGSAPGHREQVHGQHFALQQRDTGGERKDGAELFCEVGSCLWLRCNPFRLKGERCCASEASGVPTQDTGVSAGWPTGQAAPRPWCCCR